MGQRASDGVGWHARVQVVRAVVVARNGAGDPSMWVGTRGSGPGACGQGRRQGEVRVWVVGGTCILVGLHRHVHGVVVGDGPRHSCDARVTCRRLYGKADFILCGIDVDGGLACVTRGQTLLGVVVCALLLGAHPCPQTKLARSESPLGGEGAGGRYLAIWLLEKSMVQTLDLLHHVT